MTNDRIEGLADDPKGGSVYPSKFDKCFVVGDRPGRKFRLHERKPFWPSCPLPAEFDTRQGIELTPGSVFYDPIDARQNIRGDLDRANPGAKVCQYTAGAL